MATFQRPASPLAGRHPFEPAEAPEAPETTRAEQIVPSAPPTAKSSSRSKETPPQTPANGAVEEAKKTSVGVWMYPKDQARLRAAYRATISAEGYRSFSDFALRALLDRATELEEQYNGGEPWTPIEPGSLPTGRPVS